MLLCFTKFCEKTFLKQRYNHHTCFQATFDKSQWSIEFQKHEKKSHTSCHGNATKLNAGVFEINSYHQIYTLCCIKNEINSTSRKIESVIRLYTIYEGLSCDSAVVVGSLKQTTSTCEKHEGNFLFNFDVFFSLIWFEAFFRFWIFHEILVSILWFFVLVHTDCCLFYIRRVTVVHYI